MILLHLTTWNTWLWPVVVVEVMAMILVEVVEVVEEWY
jgi:hypothetical protein